MEEDNEIGSVILWAIVLIVIGILAINYNY